MSDFTGIDVIDSLDKHGTLKENKIVVLTATNITDEEIEELKRRGVHMALRKPIVTNNLLTVIQ